MHTAYIGMGANLPSSAGPPEATLTAAAARLESLGHVTCRSSLYSTEPVGFADQPRFVNAVIALETELEPGPLLGALLGIEREFGRDRSASIPNGPRTLDLDVLLLGNVQLNEPGLVIPHPRLGARIFVLLPLNEIAPSLIPAGQSQTVSQWLKSLKAPDAKDPKPKNDAAIRIQWPDWHPGPRPAGAGNAFPERADAVQPDPDRRR